MAAWVGVLVVLVTWSVLDSWRSSVCLREREVCLAACVAAQSWNEGFEGAMLVDEGCGGAFV